MSNSTAFSPVRQCKNRDNCVHPDGPILPISEFRKQGYIYSVHCIPCLDAHFQANGYSSARTAKLFGESAELLAMGELQHQGIFVTPGNSSMFDHTDIVAWGCIRIEVKAARREAKNRWSFSFSSQMKSGLRADFVLLMPMGEGGGTFHLFPSLHPVFYFNGKLQETVTYIPFRDYSSKSMKRPYLTPDMMDDYKDAWYQIEDKRLEIIDQIKNGVYHPD